MSPKKLYRFHVENLRAINSGLKRVARPLLASIAQGDNKCTDAYVRLYALLLGAWAECRLTKLLYEPLAFTADERLRLNKYSTHYKRWQNVVELAFRKHYNVPKAELTSMRLGHTTFFRYSTLVDLLSNDLKETITLRNKLAHGQWAYPLTDDGQSVAQEQMDLLRKENCLSLQLKRRLLEYLLDIVNDLTVSKKTFDRDFDKHFHCIEELRQQLKNRSYSEFENRIHVRYIRGQQKRRANQI